MSTTAAAVAMAALAAMEATAAAAVGGNGVANKYIFNVMIMYKP